MSTPSDASLVDGFRDILSTNYLGTASMVVLVYDHLLTFDDEVTFIWQRRKGIIGILFLINRYLTPLGFIVNMIAYLSPIFTPEICRHFVKYEGAFTTVSLSIVALMMIVRIHALYGGNRAVTAFVSTMFAAQISVQAWLLSGAQAVPHPNGEHNCTMIFANNVGAWGSTYAWLPLIFDTVVLALTIFKTLSVVRAGTAGNVVRTFLRDGILYYSAIFCVNLALAVMFVAAPDGIKGIAAQFEQLITVTMMSRITISLKKESSGGGVTTWSTPSSHRARTVSFPTSNGARRGPRNKQMTFPQQDDSFELSIMVDKEVTIS